MKTENPLLLTSIQLSTLLFGKTADFQATNIDWPNLFASLFIDNPKVRWHYPVYCLVSSASASVSLSAKKAWNICRDQFIRA